MISEIIGMIIIVYLLGSVPTGLRIGKYIHHKDIRELGSGNIGTTDTFRTLGFRAGVVVLVVDVLKGAFVANQPYFLGTSGTVNPLLIGPFASLGHAVLIFDNFHGGKAAATSAGILLAYNPFLSVVACSIFIFVLCLTSMVSIASVVGISAIFIIALFTHTWISVIVAGILAGMVFHRHRSNIHRISSGKESTVSFGLGYYLREKKLNK